MGHSSVLRARLKVLAYPHSASFPPPELFISCVHPTSPGLSSRNPAGSSLLVLCILCMESLYSKFHLLETALFISVCLKILLLILREFHTMYFDHYPCPSPSSPRLILHAYPPQPSCLFILNVPSTLIRAAPNILIFIHSREQTFLLLFLAKAICIVFCKKGL